MWTCLVCGMNKPRRCVVILLLTCLTATLFYYTFLKYDQISTVPYRSRLLAYRRDAKRHHTEYKTTTRPRDLVKPTTTRSPDYNVMDVFWSEQGEDEAVQSGIRRSLEYCNPPTRMVSGEEGQVASGYKLLNVHVIIRHGIRSPMYSLPNHGMPQLTCQLHTSESSEPALAEEFVAAMTHWAKTAEPGSLAQRFGLFPNTKHCEGAQLTGPGSLQHLSNGNYLNKIYIKKWRLLPDVHDVDRELYVRTTEYSRTYQSAVALLYGFLPSVDLQKLTINRTRAINLCSSKHSALSCFCPMISKLYNTVKKESSRWAANSTLNKLIKSEVASVLDVASRRLPWVGAMIDVLAGYICHKKKLPCSLINSTKCFNWPLVDRMWKFSDLDGSKDVSSYAYHRLSRLLIHPLLYEIAQRMVNVTRGMSDVKFALYSGHDKTISPLAVSLGIHDGRWPPYGSRLVIELYGKDQQHYIKVLFNGEDRTKRLRFCAHNDFVDGLCPLHKLEDFVFHRDMQFFGQDTYAKACAL